MASYGVKYNCSFNDRNRNTILVEIRKKGYTGSVTALILTDNPLIIEDVRKDNIISKGAKLNIINNFSDRFEIAKLNTAADSTYKLDVYKNSNLIFQGWMISDVFHQNVEKNKPITLAFNNGLKHLDRYYPNFLTASTVYLTEKDIIDACLTYTHFGGNIYVNSTLYEDNLTTTEKVEHPLSNIYLNRKVFIKNDGNYDNAYDILNKILKSYNAILYEKYDSGTAKYAIEREIDRGLSSKKWFYGANASDYTTETMPSKTNLDTEILKLGTNSFTLIPAVKRYDLKLNYYIFDNILDNLFDDLYAYTGTASTLPTTINAWGYNSDYVATPTLYSNAFISNGFKYTKGTGITNSDFRDNASVGYFSRFSKDSDNETKLKLEYNVTLVSPSSSDLTFNHYIYITDGTNKGWIREQSDGSYLVVDSPYSSSLRVTVEVSGKDAQSDINISKNIDLTGELTGWADSIDIKFIIRPPKNYLDESLNMYVGDFSLKTDNAEPDNLIEAELNNDMSKVETDELYLFDTQNWNYRNSKYRIDSSGYYQLSDAWTDATLTSLTLQNHLITNKGNYYNAPRNKFDLIITRDSVVEPDEMFETSLIQDELSSDVTLAVESMSFNVMKSEYKVKLTEYIDDLGKRIV